MSYAPDGRLLSPGEVYEAPTLSKEEEEWREDLNVTMVCPGEIGPYSGPCICICI
jgi:transcription initiation factor TFIIB